MIALKAAKRFKREDPSVSAQHKWPGRAGNAGALTGKNPTEAAVPSHLVGLPRRSLTADSVSIRLLTAGHLNKDARSFVEGDTSAAVNLSWRKRSLAQERGRVIYEIQCSVMIKQEGLFFFSRGGRLNC